MVKQLSLLAFVVFLATGCGKKEGAANLASSSDSDYSDSFIGENYATWTKINNDAFVSPTHGKRFVDVYVNDIGKASYLAEGTEIPVGTVIIKTSWESKGGAKSDVRGPVFVMEKKTPGFSPDNGDWWYGLHWSAVPESWQKRMGASQVYWHSPSKKVGYCSSCHNNYARGLGGVPD